MAALRQQAKRALRCMGTLAGAAVSRRTRPPKRQPKATPKTDTRRAPHITKFAGPTAHWRARSQASGLLVVWLISPYPPSGHLGPRMSIAKTCHGALGRPLFDNLFASILSSILDSFCVRLGLVLGSFWRSIGSPNRAKLDQKLLLLLVLSDRFFDNVEFSRNAVSPRREPHF